MATVNDIVGRVERRVIDLPASVQAETETLVREAHSHLQRRHNFREMKGLHSLTTTQGDPILGALPSDAKDPFVFRDDPYRTDDDGITTLMKAYTDRDDVIRALGSDPDLHIGEPLVLLLDLDKDGNRQFEVYPVPDGLAITSTGEYTIRIPYWKLLPLPAGTGSDWFTDNAATYLVYKATAEAFYLNWNEERGAFWDGKATIEAREVIRADKLSAASGATSLPYYTGARAPRVQR